ncbi:MAG TPA: UDP-N-acetylglucosamine 1-carboxyvinyltransferase [Candidatus Sumerlaeota bacterium]|nr:MAG: UDP-N-acetylglucosamine 1-carboxyvinyltransferase [candidate division BRC1 bacterium ADurb.Bin183]HOE62894.1 UDP-N-acetylglucosamine 1-carboxyvinyltransferase [Candidatus Sumerlaeota bacterium]HRR29807.1 UDP-N-acetylglucosamine 1-carboxyvinyltransferase [Candidatus Sumerlaeia bacterium]HON50244.1 UDP-N-acetylglucosamine 1-carboxyvinyltransferase [Candidatus Sumerlaeota bacterium]HOR63460.1 UDP-N-acetylglucosamine 1-carboxyvinyltransferase [Candidatus Sumerlaeota bacterium]
MDQFIVEGGVPLRGVVPISGAKNATLPIMAASLLANSPVTLRNVPALMDIDSMMRMLHHVGADVVRDKDSLVIDPTRFNVAEAPYDLVRKMRASFYVLGPMVAKLKKAKVSLPGGCVIGRRPVDLHIKGLEALGAKVKVEGGYVIVDKPKLKPAIFSLEGPSGSSVGATCNTLMAAVFIEGRAVIHGAAKEPEVMALVDFLNEMGAKIEVQDSTITIEGVKELHGTEHTIIPDRIEAGTYMVAAAITRGDLTIKGCHLPHMEVVVSKLREIGLEVEPVVGGARCRFANSRQSAINIRTLPYPGFPTDLQAQFSSLLALTKGESTITETIYPERFMHVAELSRMGAEISLYRATATICGVDKLQGAPVMATDLRASAALVLAALAAEGKTEILRVYHIDRGYERLEKKLEAVGARIRRVG